MIVGPRTPPPARRALNRFATLVILALLPSLAVFGWRALGVVVIVLVSHWAARRALQGRTPISKSWPRLLPIDALLLCGLLPAELLGGRSDDGSDAGFQLWPLIPCMAIAVVLLRRVRDKLPWPPFDPVIVTLLLAHALVGSGSLAPQASLQRTAIIAGDVLHAEPSSPANDGWYKRPIVEGTPALQLHWAGERLGDYLAGRSGATKPGGVSLDSLIRDELPPLEDLVLLGHPMPLGQASGVVLIGVVLWGAYRRRIDWRIPLIAASCAYVALVLLAVPTSISDHGTNWRFFAAARADVGPATALTFAHYVIFASPMLFALGLFATRGDVRPIHPRAIVLWAALLGIVTAACTLYISLNTGPLIALMFAPLAARGMDRWLARRPMKLPA